MHLRCLPGYRKCYTPMQARIVAHEYRAPISFLYPETVDKISLTLLLVSIIQAKSPNV